MKLLTILFLVTSFIDLILTNYLIPYSQIITYPLAVFIGYYSAELWRLDNEKEN